MTGAFGIVGRLARWRVWMIRLRSCLAAGFRRLWRLWSQTFCLFAGTHELAVVGDEAPLRIAEYPTYVLILGY